MTFSSGKNVYYFDFLQKISASDEKTHSERNIGMKKIKASLILSALCITAVFGLFSCFGGGSEDVSMLYYTYSDTYISSVRGECDKKLSSSGISYHNYDANGNQTTQTEQVDTAIAKGTKLLAINIVDTGSDDAAKAIIEKARGASVPVIFFNRSVSDEVIASYDKCVFVGTDYEEAGRLQGRMIGEYLLENYALCDLNGDGKISYVMFKGQQGNAEAEARTKYAVEECNKILSAAGKPEIVFYDKANSNKYLVDQNGTWSSGASNNYMKTILSGYSESNGNMVELVISNNDEMALGAIAALAEVGYNTGGKSIPVFGVDATEAAKAEIKAGRMAGTVKQDAEGMAKAISTVAGNLINDKKATDNISEDMIVSDRRINVHYSVYTGED